jgi:predicted aconitase with swiveling domain
MHAARGSSSGSSVLAEAIRAGTAPAGFIVRERDAILLLAALVATELYSRPCVIVQLDKPAYDALEHATSVTIDAGPETASLRF